MMRILIGYDMKDPAEKALAVGLDYARKLGAKLMFGSTAQYIILEADCPVLAVK
jgi:nucleotide-binding universal stress UspA family protein